MCVGLSVSGCVQVSVRVFGGLLDSMGGLLG